MTYTPCAEYEAAQSFGLHIRQKCAESIAGLHIDIQWHGSRLGQNKNQSLLGLIDGVAFTEWVSSAFHMVQ